MMSYRIENRRDRRKDFLSDIKKKATGSSGGGRSMHPSPTAPNPPQTPHTSAGLMRGAACLLPHTSPSTPTPTNSTPAKLPQGRLSDPGGPVHCVQEKW